MGYVAAVIALTKGQAALCLVAVGPQEIGGLLQPGASVAIAVALMPRSAPSITANVGDRGLQCVQQVRKGRGECGFVAIGIQPVARLAEFAVAAPLVFGIEFSAMMAVGKVDLAFDKPAWVLE